jgi:tetratricopeptide (TPR) repeat protein
MPAHRNRRIINTAGEAILVRLRQSPAAGEAAAPGRYRKKAIFAPHFYRPARFMAKEKEAKDLDISETIDKTEQYLSENKRSLSIIGGAVLLVVGGYFIYNLYWVRPQEESAQKEMFVAERYFSQDSLDLALNGDGNFPGFLEIIDNYGSSKSANLAHYYAGVCFLKKGQYDEAIEYLSGYDAEDDLTGAIALGGIGDAYLELGDQEAAVKYYKKAVNWDSNWFTGSIYAMKLAGAYELTGNWKEAKATYERIKKDYPQSTDARDIERFIARAEAMLLK